MPASIFDLHQTVLADYQAFVRSFLDIMDDRARDYVETALERERALAPAFLLQVSPSYATAETVEDLAARGALAPETADVFRTAQGKSFRLYRHQADALALAAKNESFVVTSGTGSGKSLAYFIPIVDALIKNPVSDRVAAIVVYPMNALVNSQLNALTALKDQYEHNFARPFPVSFAKYTGDTREEERAKIRAHPPNIILTNYVMAELLLVRPYDQALLRADSLRFLVFDELHTYRGRQGADVAMLIRRLKERAAAPGLIEIGTSATMVANRTASPVERRAAVADFASRLFGQKLTEASVIEETLEPFTKGEAPTSSELAAALAAPLPATIDAFRANPLARWAEHEFGLVQEPGGDWRRRTPRTLADAAAALAEATGASGPVCEAKLRALLIAAGGLARPAGGPAFAYKLHQFLSQGRELFATLEAADAREFSLDGQLHASGDRLFVPLKFCRHCGQDYYSVVADDDRLIPHPPMNAAAGEGQQPGYLMLAPAEDGWDETKLPDEWLDDKGRVKRDRRERVPRAIWVAPDGTRSPEAREGAVKMWWQPEPFGICLSCGEFYEKEREFRKLASLASEARTSATTVLATSLLRHAGATGAAEDKMLSFTDNRQDASLQAGHFNDFVHVALIRSALLAALHEKGALTFDRVADAVVEASGLALRDVARNSEIDPASSAAEDIWKTFTEITEYRLYEDLRRGWRVVQPNLEELGLLRIDYRGLGELAASEAHWQFSRELAEKSPGERENILRIVLDHIRRKLAIDAVVLQDREQQQMRRRITQYLNEFWGTGPRASELRTASAFVLRGTSARAPTGYGLSERSALGRFLRKRLPLSNTSYRPFIESLLDLFVRQGFLHGASAAGHRLFQLSADCLIWRPGEGTPPPRDPIYSRRAAAYGERERKANAYFQQFYRTAPSSLAALESREHTAQVVADGERANRERRFRWDANDTQKEIELGRRLPYLVCSPTMELGVDIADLDLVHMRNVPPSPANYVQRSGRAGRQGHPGLIFTYCGAFNSHDQWFFRHRGDMVAGEVRPPRLDLANEALVRAHLHALWLGVIRLPLGDSIREVIDVENPELSLLENVQGQIILTDALRIELLQRARRVLEDAVPELRRGGWYTDDWIENVVRDAPATFDRAFDRWRELFRATTREFTAAGADLLHAHTKEEQARAETRQDEAKRQRNLLLRIDTRSEESDFYPYRYLAAEGFLPGYNFPALPIRAWVPSAAGGGVNAHFGAHHRSSGGEFISRPRFLALREFAPGNMVYHEGARWQVASFALPPRGLEARRAKHRLCQACGTFTEDAGADLCPSCGTRFDASNSLIATTLAMPNVRLRRQDRITCEEEERVRRGYDIETFFQFAPEAGHARAREADAIADGSPLAELIYAPAATLLHINHGWRAKQVRGFGIDLETGDLVEEEEQKRNGPPKPSHIERLELAVAGTHNLLLLRLSGGAPNDALEASLQYALQRGMEEVFEVEENELGAARIGADAHRAILFYETTEGGAGVLGRLIDEPDALAEVARAALVRCHFDTEGKDQKPDCEAACYECLLSFSNQHDALILDRHVVRETLVNLTHASTLPRFGAEDWNAHLTELRAKTDERSPLERKFLDALALAHGRLPDAAQWPIPAAHCIADFFYQPNVCIFCDGSVHDGAAQAARDREIRAGLTSRGYRVVAIRYDEDLAAQLEAHKDLFGVP